MTVKTEKRLYFHHRMDSLLFQRLPWSSQTTSDNSEILLMPHQDEQQQPRTQHCLTVPFISNFKGCYNHHQMLPYYTWYRLLKYFLELLSMVLLKFIDVLNFHSHLTRSVVLKTSWILSLLLHFSLKIHLSGMFSLPNKFPNNFSTNKFFNFLTFRAGNCVLHHFTC